MGRIELDATVESHLRTFYDYIDTINSKRLALIVTKDNELILRPIVATRLDSVLMRNCGINLRNEIIEKVKGKITIFVCDRFRWSEDTHEKVR
jgi:hypothetical protein